MESLRQSEALSTRSWALEEFGHSELKHRARTKRVVSMAAALAERPDGRMTQVFSESASREAAFRALENEHILPRALVEASTCAAVKRAAAFDDIVIPVDGTCLSLGSSPAKDLHLLGDRRTTTRGLYLYHSVLVSYGGEMFGVGHQEYYDRQLRKERISRNERRRMPIENKEIRHWLVCIKENERAFAEQGVEVSRTYLLDRGGDFREMLQYATEAPHKMIIRSAWNRRIEAKLDHDEKKYLQQSLESAPVFGAFELDIRAGKNRTARRAVMEVRAEHYTFRITDTHQRKVEPVSMWVVWTREISPVPEKEQPVQWRLLSTHPVTTIEEARDVVYRYTLRWRIEDMHRCWKTVCGIEKTRLRYRDNILRLAIIMASVAVRIERIKTLSRAEPDAPATRLFSPIEIEVIKRLRFRDEVVPDDPVTIKQAVEWVAQLGGYIGARNGPPGSETIGRGLMHLDIALSTLRAVGWKSPDASDLDESDQ